MKFKIVLLLSILIILYVYSSEIKFMPNFRHRSDGWHLIYPILIFSFILISQFLWAIFVMIKEKKKSWKMITIMILTFFSFLLLNNLKGNLNSIAYIAMIIIAISSIKFYYFEKYK